ncbi:hypothetical protein ACHWQZ_G004323 [Mnemiopsis leidyi]
MSSVQTKGNKNINRNEQVTSTRRKKKSSRRRSEDTGLGTRSRRRRRSSSGSSKEEEGSLSTTLTDTTGPDSKAYQRKISTGSGNRNKNSNLNSTRKPQERRISGRDIVALLDEQRSFREELEDINRTNFNLEHLLSNCALKVENFNRKLLLVEYELSDYNTANSPTTSCPKDTEMKWNKEKEKVITEDELLSRNVPIRRSNVGDKSPSSSPTFDHGRQKLEKYAKIHGIVDVEIELYSSGDDMETTSDNRETTDMEEECNLGRESESENTFSYGDKQESGDKQGRFKKSNGDLTKEIVRSTSKPFRFSTRDELVEPAFKIDHNLPSDLLPADSTPRSKSDFNPEPVSPAVNVEYSLVDADHDIFSHSIHSNDTIEQIDIVFPAENTLLSSMAKTSSTVKDDNNNNNNNNLWPEIPTTMLGSDDGLGGSWVDDVLRLYDRESSRERESLSETALSNYRMETMSSSSFFSEDDDRIAVKINSSSSREKEASKTSNGYPPDSARDSADYSDWVFSPDVKIPSENKTDIKHESDPLNASESKRSSEGKRRSSTGSRRSSADNIRVSKSKSSSRRSSLDKKGSQSNSRRSSFDKKLSSSSSRRSSLDRKHSSPSSSRSSTPDSARSGRRSSTPDSRRSNRGCTPDVIPEEPAAEVSDVDFAKSLEDLVDDFAINVKTPKQENVTKKNGGFFAEDEDFSKSLEDLVDAFTEDDDLREADAIAEADESAEDGETDEQKMRRKESEAVDKLLADLDITEEVIQRAYNTPAITIETGVEDGAWSLREHKNSIVPEPDVFSRAESPITEADRRSEAHSVFGFEDSDEEERKRKWRERPFPKRAARSFFARLCACWHH